ncbi:MAG: MMPL family transporter, partial [Mycobacterium sp.]
MTEYHPRHQSKARRPRAPRQRKAATTHARKAAAGRPRAHRSASQRLRDFVVRRPLIVVGAWAALVATLYVTLPSLTQVVHEHPVPLVPADSPAMATAQQMSEAFHESGSDNVLLAVLTTENGLGPGEEDVYRALVDQLRQDPRDV